MHKKFPSDSHLIMTFPVPGLVTLTSATEDFRRP